MAQDFSTGLVAASQMQVRSSGGTSTDVGFVIGTDQFVPVIDGRSGKATYSASQSNTTDVVGDQFVISGSASKTIRVTYVDVTIIGNNTTTYNDIGIQLIKRSTADTGGTSSALTAVPHDSNNSAATASVLAYSVAPTVGTAVGTIRSIDLVDGALTTSGAVQSMTMTYDFSKAGQEIVLRGTSQSLAANVAILNGGASITFSIQWTEE